MAGNCWNLSQLIKLEIVVTNLTLLKGQFHEIVKPFFGQLRTDGNYFESFLFYLAITNRRKLFRDFLFYLANKFVKNVWPRCV